MNGTSDRSHAPCAACAKAAGLDRRTFLSAATLAAAAALLDACSGSSATFFTGPAGGPLTVKLSDYPSLGTTGQPVRVDNGNGAPTALVRTGATSFVALSMVCTHQGATINVNGTGFRCPNHGALFSATGAWAGGQPTTSLNSYTATFDSAANTVTIARPS